MSVWLCQKKGHTHKHIHFSIACSLTLLFQSQKVLIPQHTIRDSKWHGLWKGYSSKWFHSSAIATSLPHIPSITDVGLIAHDVAGSHFEV